MARRWRVYHSDPSRDGSSTLELSPEEAHHVSQVLRLGPGDALTVFDGRGREWQATLLDRAEARITVRLGAEITDVVEPGIDVSLFQGLCQPPRMDWIVQKATEVGVVAIHLLSTRRSNAREPSSGQIARWRRLAVEGSKQCGRRQVPAVEPCADLPEAADPSLLAVVLVTTADAPPLGQLDPARAPERVWLAVGPESGLTPAEVTDGTRKGWKRASLGPRTLRADTAGVIAAALVLHRWGDLG